MSNWRICSKEDACPDFSSWPFKWDETHEQVFRGMIDATELSRLKALLDRDVKDLASYANAGPDVGVFRISINLPPFNDGHGDGRAA